jgi:antitoxin (DNA-binding transcriptional repressor) of toxin-antitoxin stability system
MLGAEERRLRMGQYAARRSERRQRRLSRAKSRLDGEVMPLMVDQGVSSLLAATIKVCYTRHKVCVCSTRKRGLTMKKLSVRQAREALSHLDRLLEVEGEVAITRRGEEIARVIQAHRRRPIPSHRDLRQGMRRIRRTSERLVRQDRDAR